MQHSFRNLIDQTYTFPQASFRMQGSGLLFNEINLMDLVQRFGSPLKITYLPKIGEKIQQARDYFQKAMDKCGYRQPYEFAYCTKSSHFRHVLEEVAQQGVHIEISSYFDTAILVDMAERGLLRKDVYVLCNGYKTADYFAGIQRLIRVGFTNVIPILDCMSELRVYETFDVETLEIGLRMATEEDPKAYTYTSRFGIRRAELLDFYKYRIARHPKLKLKMLHFFVYTGINDSTYYWSELRKHIKMYVEMKRLCPDLEALNIGGGLPFQNSLDFGYRYQYMCDEIVGQVKSYCDASNVPEPRLFSEFGSFTVAESGGIIFKVLGVKRQNDRENWYIIDNSFISTLPDMWANKQKFIVLPINKWHEEYQRVVLGGLTCDNDDYFNLVSETEELFLPKVKLESIEPLYIGFFHTGAYQDSLGGYGGVHHCLVPAPKHILIKKKPDGGLDYQLFVAEQREEEVLRILGY